VKTDPKWGHCRILTAAMTEPEDASVAARQAATVLRQRAEALLVPLLDRMAGRLDARTQKEAQRVVGLLVDWVIARQEGPPAPPSLADRTAAYLRFRQRQGLDFDGVFEDLRTLRRSAWLALTAELRAGALDAGQVGLALNEAIDELLHDLVRALHIQETLSLREAATTDSLTGLFNHRQFFLRLQDELKRASRARYPVALLLLDIDAFKRFNDEQGHPAGDEVLEQMAEVLVTQRRSTDTCARYGGEEFAMILPATPKQVVAGVAGNLAQRFQLGTGLTFSGGIAAYPDDGDTPDALVKAADRALYRAKDEGRNRVLPA
jgi:diguanylate cyclase (GGDEF)-like protein